MSLFPAVAIQVLRVGPGRYGPDGLWVDGAPSVFTVMGSVHPASGQKLQALPEGDRAAEGYEIYTDQVLMTSDPATQTRADKVLFSAWDLLQDNLGNGIVDNFGNPIALSMSWPFKIVWSKPWNNGIIPHCEAIAVRIKEGATA
jgi:hypothetical protein